MAAPPLGPSILRSRATSTTPGAEPRRQGLWPCAIFRTIMAIRIRSYRNSDRHFLEAGAAELQDAMAQADPWRRLSRAGSFARTDTAMMLRKVRKHHGFILVAADRGRHVGFPSGWVHPVSLHQRQGEGPNRTGYISDLVVMCGWRGRGFVSRLIAESEWRFASGLRHGLHRGLLPQRGCEAALSGQGLPSPPSLPGEADWRAPRDLEGGLAPPTVEALRAVAAGRGIRAPCPGHPRDSP